MTTPQPTGLKEQDIKERITRKKNKLVDPTRQSEIYTKEEEERY
jgi:hypothetical protein